METLTQSKCLILNKLVPGRQFHSTQTTNDVFSSGSLIKCGQSGCKSCHEELICLLCHFLTDSSSSTSQTTSLAEYRHSFLNLVKTSAHFSNIYSFDYISINKLLANTYEEDFVLNCTRKPTKKIVFVIFSPFLSSFSLSRLIYAAPTVKDSVSLQIFLYFALIFKDGA